MVRTCPRRGSQRSRGSHPSIRQLDRPRPGVHYAGDGAFIPDNAVPPAVANPVIDYVPHAKPGYRAPHIWLRRGDERISTILLFDRFTLLTGSEGDVCYRAVECPADPTATLKAVMDQILCRTKA
jgi:hypothetical protein